MKEDALDAICSFIRAAANLVEIMEQSFKVNTVLFTKDGRKAGNCIIQAYDPQTGRYQVKSDYGNTIFIDERTINKNFRIGHITRGNHKNFTPIK